ESRAAASENPSDDPESQAAELDAAADEDFSMVFDDDMAQPKPVDLSTLNPATVKPRAATQQETAAAAAKPSTPLTLAPANDDQQRPDRPRLLAEQRLPRTIYWATTALSTIWVGGTL